MNEQELSLTSQDKQKLTSLEKEIDSLKKEMYLNDQSESAKKEENKVEVEAL